MTTLLLLSTLASAGELKMQHQLAASWFPKGLRYQFGLEDRFSLWTQKGSLLFDDTYVAPGVRVQVTPAYARVGPTISFAPIAVFDIQLEALAYGYFGTFTGVTDFDAPDADYTDAAFATGAVEARRHAGWGFRVKASPTVQAKVGHFIVALPQEFSYWWTAPPDGATGAYWYESELDCLMKWQDVVMANGAVAFWEFLAERDDDPRFVWAGVKFDHQYVFGTGDRQLKLGPMVVFRASKSKWVPTGILFAQAWLASGGDPAVHEPLPPYLAGAAIW